MPIGFSDRENFVRAIEFRRPQWIPIQFDLLPAVIVRHGDALREVMRTHPGVFPGNAVDVATTVHDDPLYTAGSTYVDDWACVWRNVHDGVLGRVVEHPLADWAALDTLKIPDPDQQEDWNRLRLSVARQRDEGRLTQGYLSVVNGGFFDRLQFLRGLENLLVDLVTEPPELSRLIELVLGYNMEVIHRWLDIGVDVLHCHGDIGTQRGLLMSPETFRRQLKPAYRRMFRICRQVGTHVKYSSDGNLLDIVDDLIECGVSCHDPQVGACGIDGIAQAYRGKLCAMVDIDEQMLPVWTPREIDRQVREIVDQIGSPAGGLMLYVCPSADVPLENIDVVCRAWERYCLS